MNPFPPHGRMARAAGVPALVLVLVPGIAIAATVARAAGVRSSAARASVPGAIEQRTFKVDVSGVQWTTWTLHDPSQNACDPALNGSGSERVSFRSVRPERIVVRRYGTSYVIIGDPFHVAGNDLLTRATVTRHGTVSPTPVSPGCGDNGGLGGPAPPPDCGTKRVVFDVRISYVNQPRHGFTLTEGDLGTLVDPFKNCPWTGGVVTFPKLLDEQDLKPVLAALRVADLFNRAYGQQIVLGHGRQTTDEAGVGTTTRIGWSIRLTSVKR